MNTRFAVPFFAVLLAVAAATGGTALSQQTPAPSPSPAPRSLPTLPPNTSEIVRDAIDALAGAVKSPYGWDPNRALGTVTFFRGYDMQLHMQLDKYRDVHLHRGTVINPRGWTLAPGQVVDVRGRARSDGSMDADVITLKH